MGKPRLARPRLGCPLRRPSVSAQNAVARSRAFLHLAFAATANLVSSFIIATMTSLLSFVRYLRLKLLVSFFRFLTRLFGPPLKSNPDIVLAIPSRDKGRTIRAHLYRPQTNNSVPPVLVNFFGSGFAVPLHGTDDLFCRRVADQTGYAVLDINYRLAPEHPFPAAINDAEDAAKYVLNHPEAYKTSHISVSGFSSGGTCALAILTLFPRGTFRSAITFYPSTNAAQDPSLRVAPMPGGQRVPLFWTRVFRDAYFADADPQDPRISPINADTRNYPDHMVMITAEMDTSAVESEALAERAASEDGRTVVTRRMKGVGHNFDKKTNGICVQAREESYGLALDMLKQVAADSKL